MRSICQKISSWSGVILLLTAPIFLFIKPEQAWVLALLPVLALIRWVGKNRPIPRTPLDLPLAILTMMIGVSLWATPDWRFSFPKVVGLLFGIAIYYGIFDSLNCYPATIGVAIRLYLGSGVALASIGVLGMAEIGLKIPALGTIIGRLPSISLVSQEISPNQVGGVLTLIVPTVFVGMLLLAREKTARWRILFPLGGFLFSALLLLITQSRGAWIGVGLACVGSGLLFLRQKRHAFLFLGILALITATILATGLFSTNQQTANSVMSRFEIWSRGLTALADFPLTGIGMNSFRRVVVDLYPPFFYTGEDFAHAHNLWLQTGIDLGIPGVVAFIALWLLSAKMVKRVWDSAESEPHRLLIVTMGAGLLAHAIFSFFDALALGSKPSFLLWFCWAIIAHLHECLITTRKES